MTEQHADIRAAVARLCGDFPGEYWRALDRRRAYPQEFVSALAGAGYLSILIPEAYGGAGLGLGAACAVLEEIQKSGCNGGACHAQMYTMATLLKHGSEEQKRRYLPQIASGELRLQAFAVTEPSSGTDTTRIRTSAQRDGKRLSGERPEGIHLAHRALGLDAAARANDAARAGREDDGRDVGAARRSTHRRGQRPHDQAARDDDESRDDRALFRRARGARGEPDRRGGEGLPLHPRQHECGTDSDRGRMRRGCALVHRQSVRVRDGARSVRPADRPEPRGAIPDRACARPDAKRRR